MDWDGAYVGSNYTELVSQAVDSPGAAGQAFVTEYAGPSNVVSTDGLSDLRWNAASFTALGALDVVDELERQGLMRCSSPVDCVATHPQVLPILRNYLPAPAGVSEGQFWACTFCYADQFDATAFDSAAFAQDIDARIIQPGRHAEQLIGQWPYLTRLFTTISPS